MLKNTVSGCYNNYVVYIAALLKALVGTPVMVVVVDDANRRHAAVLRAARLCLSNELKSK